MAKRTPHAHASSRRGRRVFCLAAAVAFAVQFLPDLQVSELADKGSLVAFTAPCGLVGVSASSPCGQVKAKHFVDGTAGAAANYDDFGCDSYGRRMTTMSAVGQAATATSISTKVLNAMGAGAVAAVIQAAIAACMEPIVNRVLVKRMKIMDAINEVTPAMMFNYFKTTISTNLLKFPLFEAINAFCGTVPIPSSARGIFTGFVFTTVTLPITNFRYRKSMQLPVNWGNIYEAYLPTVVRDMVYGVVRNYATVFTLTQNPQWTVNSPQVLFIVVLIGCFASAPLNELRGYLLQTKGQKMTFGEFFKPANFIRSTTLGAMQQAVALAIGYWCAPIAKKAVISILGHFH